MICQICKKYGHPASKCWWRYGDDDHDNDTNEKGANAAYGVDTNWYPDSGATDHITDNLDKMIRDKYRGRDKVHIANGEGMQISHIFHSCIKTPNRDIHLQNILHVPSTTKNLLSVHKLALDNDIFLNFIHGIFSLRIEPRRKLFLRDGAKVDSTPLFHHHHPRLSKFMSSPSPQLKGGIVGLVIPQVE